MIDIPNEDVFLLSEGPKKVGKSRTRLQTYICEGVRIDKDPSKPLVYLERCELPGGRATSVEAYNRFLIAINTDPNGGD